MFGTRHLRHDAFGRPHEPRNENALALPYYPELSRRTRESFSRPACEIGGILYVTIGEIPQAYGNKCKCPSLVSCLRVIVTSEPETNCPKNVALWQFLVGWETE